MDVENHYDTVDNKDDFDAKLSKVPLLEKLEKGQSTYL